MLPAALLALRAALFLERLGHVHVVRAPRLRLGLFVPVAQLVRRLGGRAKAEEEEEEEEEKEEARSGGGGGGEEGKKKKKQKLKKKTPETLPQMSLPS